LPQSVREPSAQSSVHDVLVGLHTRRQRAPAGHVIVQALDAVHSCSHEAPALHDVAQPSLVVPQESFDWVQPTHARLHGPFKLHTTLQVAPFSQRASQRLLLSPCRQLWIPHEQHPVQVVEQSPLTPLHDSACSAAVQAPPWMGAQPVGSDASADASTGPPPSGVAASATASSVRNSESKSREHAHVPPTMARHAMTARTDTIRGP